MRSRSWFLLGCVAVGAAISPIAPVGVAAADGSGESCSIRGKGVLEKGVMLWSDKSGGTAVAQFATQEVSIEVSDFPADSTGRARAKTGGSGAAFRISGWVDPTKVPISAKGDIPIVADHVWIGRGQTLKWRGSEPGKLSVETTIVATQQVLKAKAACGVVAIGPVTADEVEIPKGAKKWVVKSSTLDLYGEPGGGVVFTIDLAAPESGILLWSTDPATSYIHVHHFGSEVIDAFAKTADLKPLPKGEMLDELAGPGTVTIAPAKLKVEGAIKQVTAAKDTPIRLTANDAAKPIGTIDSGADVTVIDTVGGWSRVFPKGLEVIPPDGKDFWVKASDLGI